MPTTTPPDPEFAKVREIARGALDNARKWEARAARFDCDLDGVRVEVTVTRDRLANQDDGAPDWGSEHVTVKAGPRNKPRVLLACPAEMLDA